MAKSFQPELFEHVFHPLNAWLEQRFEEVTAREFYRELFPAGAWCGRGERRIRAGGRSPVSVKPGCLGTRF